MRVFNFKSWLIIREKVVYQPTLKWFHINQLKNNSSNVDTGSNNGNSIVAFLSGCGVGALFGYGFGSYKNKNLIRKDPIVKQIASKIQCPMKSRFSLSPIVANSNPAIVSVRLIKNNIILSEHSGFFVDHTGLVMTTGTDPSKFDSISIKTHDGRTFPANLLEYDTASGLCLIKAVSQSPVFFHSLILSRKDELQSNPGDFVMSLGSSSSNCSNHFSFGILRAPKSDHLGSENCLVSEMAVRDTFTAGGPLLNMKGKVIGVTKSDSNPNVSNQLAVPIQCGRILLERIKKSSDIGYSLSNSSMVVVSDKLDIEDDKLKPLRKDSFFR